MKKFMKWLEFVGFALTIMVLIVIFNIALIKGVMYLDPDFGNDKKNECPCVCKESK